jgi:hypothetical protein
MEYTLTFATATRSFESWIQNVWKWKNEIIINYVLSKATRPVHCLDFQVIRTIRTPGHSLSRTWRIIAKAQWWDTVREPQCTLTSRLPPRALWKLDSTRRFWIRGSVWGAGNFVLESDF